MRGALISHRDDPRRLASAVYGLVVVVSLLAVYGDDTSKSLGQIAAGIVITALVFWIAHVYTELVGHRRARGHRATWPEIREAATENWPLVTITLLPVTVLLLGAAGVLERDSATGIASAVCLAELFVIGSLLEREEGGSRVAILVSGLISLSFGVVVIVLKALVH